MGLIIKSNVRSKTELSVSDEFLVELEKKVDEMLMSAESRAKGNFRRTLFARDL
ncbi:hypothetical protein HN747_03260 [archaeon]|jgi:hypothetical protein|nr:hypothetical protein [archaeon]